MGSAKPSSANVGGISGSSYTSTGGTNDFSGRGLSAPRFFLCLNGPGWAPFGAPGRRLGGAAPAGEFFLKPDLFLGFGFGMSWRGLPMMAGLQPADFKPCMVHG